jgi:hypothetical protein
MGSVEQELLLRAAHTALTPHQARRVRNLVRDDLDWDGLLTTARRHGVLPLLQRSLSAAGCATVPPLVDQQLRAYCAALALRNRYLTQELVEVIDELERRDIRVMAFKGPVLAAAVYGHVELRPFGDLDVLVTRRDVVAAREALVARGYCLDPPFSRPTQVAYVAGLTGPRLAEYLRSRSEHHFVRAADRVLVDLHVALADPFIRYPLPTEVLLDRSESMALGGRTLRVPAAEDLLLLLALNGAKDRWERLQRLCDVAELIRSRPDVDWELARRRADRLGVRRMLEVTLWLVEELLETVPPAPAVLRRPPDTATLRLAGDAIERLFTADEHRPELSLAYSWAMLDARERLRDRAWYGLHLVLTPGVSDWMLVRLPHQWRALYWVIRPLRLAAGLLSRLSRAAAAAAQRRRPGHLRSS